MPAKTRLSSVLRSRRALAIAASALASLLAPAPAVAAPAPALDVTLMSTPTNFAPGDTYETNGSTYFGNIYNVGAAPTTDTLTLTDVLPAGITPTSVEMLLLERPSHTEAACTIGTPTPQTVVCSYPAALPPGWMVKFQIEVAVDPSIPAPAPLETQVTISGGGIVEATASTTTGISTTPTIPHLELLPGTQGLLASLSAEDGVAVTQAGSHANDLLVNLGFTTNPSESEADLSTLWIPADGGWRDNRTTLPPGLIVNPQATPALCTEAQLESYSCPDASGIGYSRTGTFLGIPAWGDTAVMNVVPPPGAGSSFGFDASGGAAGVWIHILGGVRPGHYAGGYTLYASVSDILARWGDPATSEHLHLWGDPSSPVHDTNRGTCGGGFGSQNGATCPVEAQSSPLITLPSTCASSLSIKDEIDSWGHPGEFRGRSAPLSDSLGNPSPITGCSALEFEPTLKARPTTSVADAPSGLEVDLHIPQHEELGTLAEAQLKDTVVTLPEGFTINPSSANGLAGCGSARIGIDPGTGVPNGEEPACPEASRIGTVEVTTPLLDHSLPGSVYVAESFDNPFDSLLAIYVVIDDPQTGTLVKLAGKVEADPDTGQLKTTFSNNPQLPFEDFKLDFFGGAGGVLRTPAVCGEYSTTSQLAPWSGTPAATSSDRYEISQAPGGGPCPSARGTEPTPLAFDAGTVSPLAGFYSPMVINLHRDDGSQEISTLTLTPPPGLLGKLAGIPYCPDSALSAAAAKTGHEEKASPSCPDASKLGTVTVGAGAGPAPYYTTGNAYLTGPYKGAPLGIAIITAATAGPYDLGTVVVRAALHVDPETARITAVSDRIPHILQGIPLDIRSIAVKLDRPQFILNGTSCDPLAFTGQELSVPGALTPLSSHFQLGECAPLPFKPQLSIHLKGKTNRGGHPALSASLQMAPGSANIANAQVTLPHSEFLEQAHIKTICTRVQFAAEQCPPGSIYGRARAETPLLGQPLEGPVYLRSSSHKLPDLVADLDGQIEVVLDGRIDSVKGGIRSSFEAVPDAPVSKFVLEMQGGKKGLLVNSTNLCKSVHRATVDFTAQNGKTSDSTPVVSDSCKRKGKGKKGGKAHRKKGRGE